jgi:hypothetical protein
LKNPFFHTLQAHRAESNQALPQRKVLGKDVNAIKGQIVRHVEGGRHVEGECDRDYLSGGLEGVILDVCGDYAQVSGGTHV